MVPMDHTIYGKALVTNRMVTWQTTLIVQL